MLMLTVFDLFLSRCFVTLLPLHIYVHGITERGSGLDLVTAHTSAAAAAADVVSDVILHHIDNLLHV